MVLALTYSRGRVQTPTVEASSPVRSAGQFTNYTSAQVLAGDEIRLPTPPPLAEGSAIIWYEPDDDSSYASVRKLFDYGGGAGADRLYGQIDGSGSPTIRSRVGGSNNNATAALTAFAADAALKVYFGWSTPANVVEAGHLSGVIATGTRSFGTPVPTNSYVNVGSNYSVGEPAKGGISAVAFFNRRLTAQERAYFALLERPPIFGEVVGDAMVSLWWGASELQWTADGVLNFIPLDGNLVVTALDGMGIPEMRHLIIESALRDGGIYVEPALANPRRISVHLSVTDDSVKLFYETQRRRTIRALNPKNGIGTLSFSTDTWNYEIDSILEGGLSYDNHKGPSFQEQELKFLCPDPFWRRSTVVLSGVVPAGGWEFPWSFPWIFDPAEIDFNINNDGDVPVYPIVTFTAIGDTEGVGIRNVTTGLEFKLDGLSLVNGDVVVIDMDARTAVLNGVTNVLGYRGASRVWAIEVGSNDITAFVDTGSADVDIIYSVQLIGV